MTVLSYPSLRAAYSTVNPAPPVKRYPMWLIGVSVLGIVAIAATFYYGPRLSQ